jgi:hypothetical protein
MATGVVVALPKSIRYPIRYLDCLSFSVTYKEGSGFADKPAVFEGGLLERVRTGTETSDAEGFREIAGTS